MMVRGLKKTMALTSLFVLGVASATSAYADNITQEVSLDDFDKIVIEGAVNLDVMVGKSQKVEVKTDEDFMEYVKVSVSDGTLTIGQKRANWDDVILDVSISVEELNNITVDGAADANIEGVSSDSFVVEINGAVDMDLEGTCGFGDFRINGAGDINAKDLECKEVDVVINGAGDVDVYASVKVSAVLNGIGDVNVYGDPDSVRPRINGLGSFDIK